MNYAEKLKDSRWQLLRLQILERDEYECQRCHSDNKILQVHHLIYYSNREPWDYEDDDLITLCIDCHEIVGTKFIFEEIHNPWIAYSETKRQIPAEFSPMQYEIQISEICGHLNV